MANISNTEVDATRQALIASIVQMTLKQQSVLVPTVTDYSSFAVPGAKSVGAPRRTQFAAADKTEETDLTGQTFTFSADTINLDKHKAIYTLLEKISGVQANVNVEAEILKEMAAELALQIDKDIIVQLKLASAAAPDHIIQLGTGGTLLNQDNILESRKLLSQQVVPLGDRYLVVSPAQEKSMLSIADFVRADSYGSPAGLMNGELGRIYGATVLMHTGLADAEALYYHKSSVGFAQQIQPEYQTNYLLKSVAQEYLLHHLYGVKVLDSGKRNVFLNATGA